MLTILMAVSTDGFLATGPNDDMKWTSKDDKAIFRLLTLASPHPLLAGRVTAEQLPPLPNREVVPLVRERTKPGQFTLQLASHLLDGALLIGGPTVALEALKANMVNRVVLCYAKAELKQGMPVQPLLDVMNAPDKNGQPTFTKCKPVQLGDVRVEIYQWR